MTASFRSIFQSSTERSQRLLNAREIIEDLEIELSSTSLQAPPGRPYLILNMASTVDGRASIHGRSGEIGNRADRELFHELRSVVDAVMVGAATLRTERYNRIVDDPQLRERRRERALAEEPFACVVSDSLQLTGEIPLLADRCARVVILTSSSASLPPTAASVQYIRAAERGSLDLAGALGELRERLGVRTLLCEGGPRLNGALLAAGLVDELLLCFAAKLAGQAAGEPTPRIVTGADLDPPVGLQLIGALESQSYLFLRYRVQAS